MNGKIRYRFLGAEVNRRANQRSHSVDLKSAAMRGGLGYFASL